LVCSMTYPEPGCPSCGVLVPPTPEPLIVHTRMVIYRSHGRAQGGELLLSEVRNAERHEMDILIEAARSEGWNPGLYDAESFYACDPRGFWLGIDEEGRTVSTLSFVNYPGSDFSFVGFYVVKPGHRHRGNGRELWNRVFDMNPGRNIGLDGVPSQMENYMKRDFKLHGNNRRYCGRDLALMGHLGNLAEADTVPFEDVCMYDRLHFPAPRESFLEPWIRNSYRSLVYLEAGVVRGFGVVRECLEGYKIGPLFCDNRHIAYDLVCGLAEGLRGEDIYLDVMNENQEAKMLVEKLGMKHVFSTARMYTGKRPDIRWDNVFGITTFELG